MYIYTFGSNLRIVTPLEIELLHFTPLDLSPIYTFFNVNIFIEKQLIIKN